MRRNIMPKPDHRLFFGDDEVDPIAKAAEKILKQTQGEEEAKRKEALFGKAEPEKK
jgi:hypothetical protein